MRRRRGRRGTSGLRSRALCRVDLRRRAGRTDRLLDLLAARGVRATFFVLGQQVREHPTVTRRLAAEGHEIGNHTWNHRRLTSLTAAVQADLRRTAETVHEVTGTTPTLVRPPFGSVDDAVSRGIDAPIILWSVDPRDWRNRDSRVVHQRVIADVRPGAIVVLHDVYSPTVDAVPGIIDTLKDQGYTFVTVSELFGGHLEAGQSYTSGARPPE
jgi:peptidoglycan/xylan/chitin deacetylase (PgdA/CDA1 family)